MFEVVIAECPHCGACRYSFCEEEAVAKLSKHRCLSTLSDEEVYELNGNTLKDTKEEK